MNPATPPLPPKSRKEKWRDGLVVTSILILLPYAGIFYVLFHRGSLMREAGGLVSCAFLFSVPFALGALSVGIARWRGSERWFYSSVVGPSIALTACIVICYLTKMEAILCIIMAAPALYGGSILGGLIAHFLLPRKGSRGELQITLAVLLPFAAAAVEGSLAWTPQIRSIENTIVIHAPPERIWPEITSVRSIPPQEIPRKWIYLVGFPKPIAATLDHEGIGGVRTATFDRGVSFFEKVTEWDPLRKISFTIHADPDFIPHTAFDRHIIVGGRFYDVLDGTYEIEQTAPGICTLHLTSNHRLGTHFNSYAGWWSERIMDQIQGSILEVIRRRAETPRDTSMALQRFPGGSF